MPKFVPIPVLIDTREQRPWEFDSEFFTAERATLATGDYTVKGYEDVLRLERKSLGDAVGTFIGSWLRFRKELNRLAAFDCAAIVIEADLGDILAHRYESDAEPSAVLGRMNGIYLDHSIPCFLWGKRAECVPMVERFLLQAVKKLRV